MGRKPAVVDERLGTESGMKWLPFIALVANSATMLATYMMAGLHAPYPMIWSVAVPIPLCAFIPVLYLFTDCEKRKKQ